MNEILTVKHDTLVAYTEHPYGSSSEEERLRLAVALTGIGTWDYNPLTRDLHLSDECKDIYALPRGMNADYDLLIHHIHPDDKMLAESAIANAFDPNGDGNYDIQYRILRYDDGSVRRVKSKGKVYFNTDQKASRFIGTLIDITEQTRFIDELRESENRFQFVLDTAPVLIWMSDTDKLCNYFNKGWLEFTGRTMEQELGNGWAEGVHPDDFKRCLEIYITSFDARKEFSMVYRLRRHDGEFRWITDNGVPRFLPDGTFLGYIGSCIDIHDRIEARKQLEEEVTKRTYAYEDANQRLEKKNIQFLESEERYHSMIEELQNYAIILLDREGNIQTWNKGAQKIKGYSADEIIGKNFNILYNEDDRKNGMPLRMIEECIAEGKSVYEGWRVRKDGSTFWGNVTLAALHGKDKSITGFTQLTRDLTDKKKTEDSLKQIALELQQKNEELKLEKEFIQTVLDSSVDLITVYDTDTRILAINKQVEELLHISREEIIGKKFLEIFPDSTASYTYNNLLRAIKGEFIHFIHPQGQMQHSFDIFMVPLKHDEQVYAVLVLTHDITSIVKLSDRLKASNDILAKRNTDLSERNEELEQQKELIETIIDTSVDFIGVYDADYRLVSINKKSLDIMKMKKEDVIGKSFHELNKGKPGTEQVLTDLTSAMNGESVHRVYPRSAETFGRDYEIFYIPLRHHTKVYATLAMVHDITDIMNISEKLRVVNATLEEKNVELERSNKELEQFAYIASHDLQEPLRKIRIFTSFIQEEIKGFNNISVSEYINKIAKASDRMSTLIKDVLNYSSLTNTEILFKPTDLNILMKQIFFDLDLVIEEKQAVITCTELPTIDAIPYQTEQLFYNLLSNSLKFTKQGVPPEVQISSTAVTEEEIIRRKLDKNMSYCKIIFKDYGIGFSPEYADRIFTIFQRLNSRQDYTGTGIGLALCRKIVGLHGGLIEAESKENEGSTFSVILPLHQSQRNAIS